MKYAEKRKVAVALDLLALALTDTGHKWSNEERDAFDNAHRILGVVDLIEEDFISTSEVSENA